MFVCSLHGCHGEEEHFIVHLEVIQCEAGNLKILIGE